MRLTILCNEYLREGYALVGGFVTPMAVEEAIANLS